MSTTALTGHEAAIAVTSVLVFISLAAERIVEMIKGWWPWLNIASTDAVEEGRRRAMIHLLTMVFGWGIVLIAYDSLAQIQGMSWMTQAQGLRYFLITLALGILSSGGSSFWNSVLTYFLSVKDIKRAEARDLQVEKAMKQESLLSPASLPRPPLMASAG